MDANQIISEIEQEAAALGMDAPALCRAANVAPITFERWKAGLNTPTFRTIYKLKAALVERARKAGAA